MTRALVLSGGGSKCAYQAGRLRYLLGDLGLHYPILCGVSGGGINAAHLAQFSLGDEATAVSELAAHWLEMRPRDVYRRWWPFGKLHGLWRSGFYDSRPLRPWLAARLDPERVKASGRTLRLGAVDLRTGEYRAFAGDYAHLVDAVIASAAYPAAFVQPVFDGARWTDGGVRDIAPLGDAIALGATAIDVILTEPPHCGTWDKPKPSAVDVLLRCISIMAKEIVENDVRDVRRVNQLVSARQAGNGKRIVQVRVFRPSSGLGDGLDFSPGHMVELLDRGYADAKEEAASAIAAADQG